VTTRERIAKRMAVSFLIVNLREWPISRFDNDHLCRRHRVPKDCELARSRVANQIARWRPNL
jgi:hypothetical protein